jgi:hypothetical protein
MGPLECLEDDARFAAASCMERQHPAGNWDRRLEGAGTGRCQVTVPNSARKVGQISEAQPPSSQAVDALRLSTLPH